jgi:hypothetical protein
LMVNLQFPHFGRRLEMDPEFRTVT